MTIDSKTYQEKGGVFVEFESQDQVQSRLGVELANNFEKSIFGIIIDLSAGFASAGVLQKNGGTAAVKWAF